jgi:putative DNA primase/helicase
MRARMHLVDFGVTIPEAERDTTYGERLEAEYGGILAWALEGCLAWQAGGLRVPASVREASAAYLESEDSISGWLDECCERRPGQLTLTAAHRSYRDWCERSGITALGRNGFGEQLEQKGFPRVELRKRVFVFDGLRLPTKPSWGDDAEDRHGDTF